jgi:hypothetical protein
MGGTKGRAPAAMTMLRVVSFSVAPLLRVTSTSQGETIFAEPSTTSTPNSV